MKILFVWTGITSYMADCWRELGTRTGVELKVVVDPLSDAQTDYQAEREFAGLDYALARTAEESAGFLKGWKPEVIFLVGWHNPVCRYFAMAEEYGRIPKICCLDMPWRWKLRCLAAPLMLRRYARRFAAAYVPGEASARYCRWIGFKRIEKGLFSMDLSKFLPKAASEYFLYLGRYSKEKRLDDVLRAYREYRANGGRRELHFYGKGEALPRGAEQEPGVVVNGFVAPKEVPRILSRAAAFVLASDFDPWPLVLLESMGAGCRVIASEKCTNYPELGAKWGRFRVGEVKKLASLMGEVERLEVADRNVIDPYDCGAWATRTLKLAKEVADD